MRENLELFKRKKNYNINSLSAYIFKKMIAVRFVSEYSYAILTYVIFSKTVDKICVSNIISIMNTQIDYSGII